MGLTREKVKAERKRLGIGTTILAKVAFNNGLGDKRTIEIYNHYAKQIFSEAYGDDPELTALGRQYIAELPRAARKGQERELIAGCETKLEAFRDAVRAYNLSINQGIIDDKAQIRYEKAEQAADARTAETKQHMTLEVNRGVEEVNVHTDESNAQQTKDINSFTGNRINFAVRRINQHTDASNARQTAAINSYTDRRVGAAEQKITTDVTQNVTQNMSAIVGVDAPGYTQKNEKGERLLVNDYSISPEESAVGQVNEHTTEETDRGIERVTAHVSAEHLETRRQDQKQAVLNAKRQTLSDMLMNEVNETRPGHGQYRDITVKWLGSAADRIMAGTDLTFEEKKEALDELVRMVDEEIVISDGDKAAFEAKYFYHTEERPHL